MESPATHMRTGRDTAHKPPFDTRLSVNSLEDGGMERDAANAIVAFATDLAGELVTKEEAAGIQKSLGDQIEYNAKEIRSEIKVLDTKIDHAVETLDTKIDHAVETLDTKIDHAVKTLDTKIDHAVETLDTKIDHVVEMLGARIDHASLRQTIWLGTIFAAAITALGLLDRFFPPPADNVDDSVRPATVQTQ